MAVDAHDFVIYQFIDKIIFGISVPGTSSAQKYVSVGEWFHFVGTYDGAEIKLYINGADNPETQAHTGTISDPGLNLSFGRRIFMDPPIYREGTIDDFRIYDRVLTAAEINELAGK